MTGRCRWCGAVLTTRALIRADDGTYRCRSFQACAARMTRQRRRGWSQLDGAPR